MHVMPNCGAAARIQNERGERFELERLKFGQRDERALLE